MTGYNAYDAADVVATIYSTAQSSALDLGAWATNNTDGMTTCARAKGYEVTFIQLNETVASAAGAEVLANDTLASTTGIAAVLQVAPPPPPPLSSSVHHLLPRPTLTHCACSGPARSTAARS